MRIAFISTMAGIPWGGSEALWSETAKLALHKGHDVFTSTYFWENKPTAIQELQQAGAESYFRPRYTSNLTKRLINRIKNVAIKQSAEIKAIHSFHPDVILLNQSGGYDIIHRPDLQQFFLTTSIPFSVICHNYDEELVLPEKDRNILLSIYSRATFVFMICQPQANAITKQLLHTLPNIKLVDNPINLNSIELIRFPSIETIQLACVASFDVERKGQDILLEVLSTKKWKERQWQLNLYGTGPHESYIKGLIAFYGLADKVVLQGHVKNINEVWQNNHILLLPSRVETGPMVLTEAMLCGRTAVATLVGRVGDFIQDEHNGFIAGAATVALYDDALERAWQNKHKWKAMGQMAYDTALATVDRAAAETFLYLLIKK